MKHTLPAALALFAAVSLGGLVICETASAAPKSAAKKPAVSKKDEPKTPPPPKEVVLEAEIDINPAELAPNSTIEVTFPTAMVSLDQVGSAAVDSPLLVEPAISGRFEWTSTRTGLYKLTQPPQFNKEYKFKLRDGVKDVDGKSLSTDVLDEATSASFRVIDQYPKWFNNDDTNRTPKFLFEFNDTVNPAEAAKAISFVLADNGAQIGAKVRHATGKDFAHHGAEAQATWAEEVSGAKPAVSDDGARMSAIVVEAEAPLTVGKKWTLNISTDLKNLSGHDALNEVASTVLGSVDPFIVREITAHTPFDRDYNVSIRFNKTIITSDNEGDPVKSKDIAQKLAAAVKIEPPVEITGTSVDWRSLSISGKFALNTDYKITVEPTISSQDGLVLEAAKDATVRFITNPPYVAVPTFMNAQLASGSGEYEASVANVKQVRIRAKKLTGPELLEAIEKYKTYEQTFYGSTKKREEFKPDSIDEYPGTIVFDRTFPINKPLDRSDIIKLKWSEVLGGAKAGPLFVELEGTAMEGAGKEDAIAQTLIEFTDLGMMQKANGRESMIFVTSLKTGKPIAAARLTMVDEERRLIGYGDTDANGIAIVRGKEPKFVIAEKDGDLTALKMRDSDGSIPMWHFGINTTWKSPWETQRRTFVFSDRGVYKPGETAHIKALTRNLIGDDLSIEEEIKGSITLRDPRYKVVMQKDITFTKTGSWSDDIVLPEGPTGGYTLSFDTPSADEDDSERNGSLFFRVEEFKANTFEVKIDTDKADLTGDRIKLPLHANYYMGKALSRAKVTWSAMRAEDFEPPQQYSAFHFGDAPRWAGYGLDGDQRWSRNRNSDDSESWDSYGDLTLREDGTAVIEMPMPPPDRASMPQNIHVSADVTDINQQTIAASGDFKVPGAEFIIGLKGPQYYGSAGKDVPLEIIAITPEGKPHGGEVAVDVKIERQSYHTLKIATAGGGSTTKDQVVLQQELAQTVAVKSSAALNFKPARGGAYFITATTTDTKGKKLLSRMPFYVIGGGEFPWAMEDGSMMDLQADKTELLPGEEATIVVKTPIAGIALVTVERNKIHRQFLTQLSPENTIIKVPVQDAEAPNVFVSVIVIRGADASPKQHKMPEYRVGYCELTVKSDSKNLAVALAPDRPEVKPGEMVSINGIVNDAKNVPQAGAEVTLYAADEGVLSLTGYKTPDPRELFHQKFALAIKNWTSLDGILNEDSTLRERGNKGFLVGGGDEEGGPLSDGEMRKNFVATPLWIATVTSDASGKIAASFKAPDNLTRYRIMAVAAAGADRFGNGEAVLTINKPLMIEPVVPRFARLADEVLLKAVVHNTTKHSGDIEVELELDDKASFITEERPFVKVALAGQQAQGSGKTQRRIVPIKAGETTSTVFPVKFDKLGTAKWKWTARTKTWPQGAEPVSDGTESEFEVNHPMPELRDVRYVRLDAKTPIENLLKDVHPQILEGDGSVDVNASASRLFEVRDALDYVMHYPYGCVEQTSSSTMPWLALGAYSDLFPEHLDKAKSKDAIQAGANRLLRMVTDDGGLAYWPGGTESSAWGTAYGGFVLMKCKDAGATVPDDVIKGILDYLSKSLRNLDTEKDPYALSNAAQALYTLAKGGKPEAAYENLLYSKRDQLPEIAKLWVALAMCIHNAPETQIKELLGWKPKAPPSEVVKKAVAASKDKKSDSKSKTKAKAAPAPAPRPAPAVWTHWWGNTVNKSLRLIAYTHLGLKQDADELATTILQQRNARGEWGNTFTNSWTLLSMSAYERSIKTTDGVLALNAKWDTLTMPLNLPKRNSSAKTSFVLNQNLAAKPLTIDIPEGQTAFARIEAKAWPRRTEFSGENKGYGITRNYAKLQPDGKSAPADDLRVGDMVLITLDIEIGGNDRYLAISDPLPAVFEAINPNFETQADDSTRAADGHEPWFCDHREIRADRALFFTDYAPGKGKFSMTYLARVIAEGDTIAPPAKIEAMYQPDKYGLSATQRLRTLPADGGKVATK